MSWWIVITGPAQERRAEAGLADGGFAVWLPQRLVRFKTRHMATPSERLYPTFPGYVFARPSGVVPVWRWERDGFKPEVKRKVDEIARDVDWREARAVGGVTGFIVSAQGVPLVVTDFEFDRVRAHLDALADRPVDAETWRKDDLARIADGPWSGLIGTVLATNKLAKRGSLTLLLATLGRLEIDAGMLERAA